MTNNSTPLPCPFCQSELGPAVYTVENWNGERVTSEKSYVECEACGGRGPECHDGPKAIEVWNKASSLTGEVGKCARCGFERKEHSYNGACYGICGEFTVASAYRKDEA